MFDEKDGSEASDLRERARGLNELADDDDREIL